MMDMLAEINPRLIYSTPVLLIANIVTGSVRCHPTGLQMTLGILFRESNQQLGCLYGYGVTCSYDEV